MPPRSTKREPAPKNRGKQTGSKAASSHRHVPFVVSKGNSSSRSEKNTTGTPGRSTSVHSGGASAYTRPPPRRLSKAVMQAQEPPVRAVPVPEVDDGEMADLAPRGFSYLSPQTLAAARRALATPQPARAAAPPAVPQAKQPHLVSPDRSPAESSLARLRALAGAPTLLLSPAASSSAASQYKNEESPLQGQPLPPPTPLSSTPNSPYTPDLVRRLAALTGTPATQMYGAVRMDRLKRTRTAAAAAAAAPTSLSPDHFESRVYNNEEAEPPMSQPMGQQNSSATTLVSAAASSSAAAAPTSSSSVDGHTEGGRGADLENEEEGRSWQRTPSPSSYSSALDRLRAARRVATPLATPPATDALPPPPWFLAASSAPSTQPPLPTSPSSSSLVNGAERLTKLRLRASASPGAAPVPTAEAFPPAPALLPPASTFMNLERMQVGRGSAAASPITNTATATVQDGNRSGVDDGVPRSGDSGAAAAAAHTMWNQAPPYTLLAQAQGKGGHSMPQPPTAVDDALNDATETARIDAHFQRYRDAAIASAAPQASAAPADAPSARRAVRRSQRHQSVSAAKKENAVAMLVKGRRGSQQPPTTSASLLTAAQKMDRLRSLSSPVPVGEAASLLPPSWSSPSPFSSLASPNLYKSLEKAAQDQRSGTAAPSGGSETAAEAFAASQPQPPQLEPDLRRLPAFFSSRGSRDVPLPASANCIVFDTSSLLDSEPGVLNLLLERAYIGIPFKVLDELDYMHKGGGGDGSATTAAMRGVNSSSGSNVPHDREWRRKRAHDLRNWIAACVGKANSHVLLQRRTEVVEEYDRHTSNNDDRILGYAVYLRRNREKVLFVTEDKFLRIKAAAEIGRAYSYSEIRQMVGMPRAVAAPSVTRRAVVRVPMFKQ